MMKFKLGETIIEPTNGICVMRGMKRMTVDGKEMTVYIFDAQSAKVFVPADQVEKRNIRRPMNRDDVKRVLAALKAPVYSPNRNDARMQYTAYREIMKSGDPMRISRLLRDLYILDESDDLKGKEKEIMDQAKKFLCDEIAFVRDASKIQVMETINEALRQMYKKKIAKDKERAKKSGTGLPLGILGYAEDESEEEELVLEEGEELDRALDEPVRRKKPAKKKMSFGDVDEDEEDEDDEETMDDDDSSDSDDDDVDEAPKSKRKR